MSTMFLLKNEVPIFTHHDFKDWNWLFLNNKEADVILYSEDGHEFRVHKEILSQTETMRSILFGFKDNYCGIMEIFCPCPKDELEQIVKFLYSGTISSDVELVKILNNLIKVFGFPKKLFLTKEELKSHGFEKKSFDDMDMDIENQCKMLNVIERSMDTFDAFNETAMDAPTDIITDEFVNSSAPLNSENNSMKKKRKLKMDEKSEFQTGGTNLDPAEYTKDVSSDNTELHFILENDNLTTLPISKPNRILNENLDIDMKKYKYLNKFGCELCDFVAQTKNKYREKQDHLSRVHFKDKIDKLVPKCRPYNCPEIDCSFVGKDNQSVLRHFIGKHDILRKLLKEALSTPNVWMKFLEKIENSSDIIQNVNAGVIIETCPDKTLNAKNITNDGAFENYEFDKDTDINILEVITKESNVFSQEKKSALLKRIESNVKNNTDIKHEKKKCSLLSGSSAQEDEECIKSERKCTGTNFAQNNIDINDSSSNQLETNLNLEMNPDVSEQNIYNSGFLKNSAVYEGAKSKEQNIRTSEFRKNNVVHEGAKPNAVTQFQSITQERKRLFGSFDCKICNASFTLKPNLLRHIDTVHEGKKPFKCRFCEYCSAAKHVLKEHEISIHLQKKPFKCNFCEAEFAIQSDLKGHIITAHERKQPIQPVYERPRCFQCHFCAKRFDLQASLDGHIISVHK